LGARIFEGALAGDCTVDRRQKRSGTDQKVSRWGKTEMTPSWGVFLFWTATIIAGLIVVWEVWGYVYDAERGEPIIWIAPLLLAAAIWLVGWACRYMFAGR